MSRLSPGRKSDMRMLLERRDRYPKYSEKWNVVQRKIEHILEEGKDPVIYRLRDRLIGAQAAQDLVEIEKISKQITQHVRYKGQHNRWIKEN